MKVNIALVLKASPSLLKTYYFHHCGQIIKFLSCLPIKLFFERHLTCQSGELQVSIELESFLLGAQGSFLKSLSFHCLKEDGICIRAPCNDCKEPEGPGNLLPQPQTESSYSVSDWDEAAVWILDWVKPRLYWKSLGYAWSGLGHQTI